MPAKTPPNKINNHSEDYYRELYEKSPLGYQSLDCDGNFLIVNRAWLDVLGYSRGDVIGKWFGDFLAPEFRDAFAKDFPCLKSAVKSTANSR